MPVAALQRDGNDFGIGIHQQLAGALQAQLGLAVAQRHAKFGAEEPAQMPLAAVELLRQLRQRPRRQFGVGYFRHELPEAVTQPQAGLVAHRRRQHGRRNGLGPELQQRRADGQRVPLRLDDEPGKFLAEGVRRAERNDRRGDFSAGLFELMTFRDRDEAVEEMRMHAIIFQF